MLSRRCAPMWSVESRRACARGLPRIGSVDDVAIIGSASWGVKRRRRHLEWSAVTSTYHLALVEEWTADPESATYAPSAFVGEGFIHCTDGEDELMAVGNRYYKDDRREFVALEIDLSRVGASVRYEDPRQVYPHIYGELERGAVVAEHRVERSSDGAFMRLEPVPDR